MRGDALIAGTADREAILTTVRDQQAEIAPLRAALPRLDCPCGKRLDLAHLYRCLHCGVWFCPTCALRHFGPDTREEERHG